MPDRLLREARCRPLHPDHGDELPARAGTGHGHRVEIVLSLPKRLREAAPADTIDLLVEHAPVGDRGHGEARSSPGGSATSPNASATFPAAVACAMLGRPIRATLCTVDGLWTKSTVTASRSPGTESVAVSPVASTSASRLGRPSSRTSRRRAPRSRARRDAGRGGNDHSPATMAIRPASTSVASTREAVLALTPVRRASSFVPISPSAATTSSTATARSTASMRRVARAPVRSCYESPRPNGHTVAEEAMYHDATRLVTLRRRRRRHPRALHCLSPREGAERPRHRLRRGHRRARQEPPGRGRHGHRVRRRPQQLLPARDERADAGLRRGLGVGPRRVSLQPGRLRRARAGGAGAGSRRGLRAPGAHRLCAPS